MDKRKALIVLPTVGVLLLKGWNLRFSGDEKGGKYVGENEGSGNNRREKA